MVTPDSGVDPELLEKVFGFIYREVGLDAPLSVDDETMLCRMIKEDPVIRGLAEDLRATHAGLNSFLDDVDAVEVPRHLRA